MSSLPTNFNTLDRSLRPTRRLAARLLPATATLLYECPKQRTATVTSVIVANIGATLEEVTLHHVIPAESAGTSNALLYGVEIPVGGTLAFEVVVTLSAGDRLIALGSTASTLCATVYGTEA